MTNSELLSLAKDAREKSYSPYTRFKVGAALLAEDGTIFTGCNIEFSTLAPSVCAERTALHKAISEGHTKFSKIAVYGSENPCPPCGVCRQTLSEFCGEDFKIIICEDGEAAEYTLGALLPKCFKLR